MCHNITAYSYGTCRGQFLAHTLSELQTPRSQCGPAPTHRAVLAVSSQWEQPCVYRAPLVDISSLAALSACAVTSSGAGLCSRGLIFWGFIGFLEWRGVLIDIAKFPSKGIKISFHSPSSSHVSSGFLFVNTWYYQSFLYFGQLDRKNISLYLKHFKWCPSILYVCSHFIFHVNHLFIYLVNFSTEFSLICCFVRAFCLLEWPCVLCCHCLFIFFLSYPVCEFFLLQKHSNSLSQIAFLKRCVNLTDLLAFAWVELCVTVLSISYACYYWSSYFFCWFLSKFCMFIFY